MDILPAVILVILSTTSATVLQIQGSVENGLCVCTVSSNWSALNDFHQLQRLKMEAASLNATVQSLNVQAILGRLNNITHRVRRLETRTRSQQPTNCTSVLVTLHLQEIRDIKLSVEILLNMSRGLTNSSANGIRIGELIEELNSLSNSVDELLSRNPHAENSDLKRELEDLRHRLTKCQERVHWSSFAGDNMPINQTDEDWCNTHELEGIGHPFTHNWHASPTGAWFKDPLPQTEDNKTQIFVRGRGRYLKRYENYTAFFYGRSSTTFPNLYTHELGYTIYDQSFYQPRGNFIYRYNLTRWRAFRGPRIGRASINYISQTSVTYMDLKVDEFGLWLIVADTGNPYFLKVIKLDPNTLRPLNTYLTTKYKQTTCAVFMVCGKLYTLNICINRRPLDRGSRVYVYNTRNSTASYTYLNITSNYMALSTLNYNPREKVLFGWDRGHLVTYKIIWRTI